MTNHGSVNQRFLKSNYNASTQNPGSVNQKYRGTGFNWKPVDMSQTRGTFTDQQPSRVGRAQKPQSMKPLRTAPKRLQGMLPTKEELQARNTSKNGTESIGPAPPNFTEIMENMAQSNQKMPHKIVSTKEFERLAALNEKDGQPMVEKTIFIVKPIYV